MQSSSSSVAVSCTSKISGPYKRKNQKTRDPENAGRQKTREARKRGDPENAGRQKTREARKRGDQKARELRNGNNRKGIAGSAGKIEFDTKSVSGLEASSHVQNCAGVARVKWKLGHSAAHFREAGGARLQCSKSHQAALRLLKAGRLGWRRKRKIVHLQQPLTFGSIAISSK